MPDSALRSVDQGIGWELQLVVDLFELPVDADGPAVRCPKTGEVRAVRSERRP